MGLRDSMRAVKGTMDAAKEAREDAARQGGEAGGAAGPGDDAAGRRSALDDQQAKVARAQELNAELSALKGSDAESVRRRGEIEAELQALWTGGGAPGDQAKRAAATQAVADATAPPSKAESRAQGLAIRVEGGPFGPGDTVTGALVLTEDVKARSIAVRLGYVEHPTSPHQDEPYVETTVHGEAAAPSAEGSAGTEVPFSFELPAEALPEWNGPALHGTPAATQMGADPEAMEHAGRLYWAVVAEADVKRGRDRRLIEPLSLVEERAAWVGPAEAGGAGRAEGRGRGFDAEIAPERPSLRRGEELAATVKIGKPDGGRALECGLLCVQASDEEVIWDPDSPSPSKTERDTVERELIRITAPLDPAQPSQRVAFRVPEGAPFSSPHRGKGSSLGFSWRAYVTEKRRMRRDPRREVEVQVLP